jgi:hypothetical protein
LKTAKTDKERQAESRKRRAALGITRLELYAHTEDHPSIKSHAAMLQSNREVFGTRKKKPNED